MATSYHPLKTHFQLTYPNDANTRVCLYVNKRIDLSTWSVTHVSKDIISLTVLNTRTGRKIHIYNVYNKVGTGTLSTLADSLSTKDPSDEAVLMGDFNLHHPLWSTTHHRASDGPNTQQLLTIVEEFITAPHSTWNPDPPMEGRGINDRPHIRHQRSSVPYDPLQDRQET
jgi:hypothetical protein